MRLGLESKCRRLAESMDLLVVGRIFSDWDAYMRHVGQLLHRHVALMFDGIQLHAELLDLGRASAARLHGRPGLFSLTFGLSDLIAGCVLLPLEALVLAY